MKIDIFLGLGQQVLLDKVERDHNFLSHSFQAHDLQNTFSKEHDHFVRGVLQRALELKNRRAKPPDVDRCFRF
jgi:hypothetical protein